MFITIFPLSQREHLIQSLNEKNAELQAAVARLLKEKNTLLGEAQKSLINPKAWLSSSPERAVITIFERKCTR